MACGRTAGTYSTSNQFGVIMVESGSIARYIETTSGETYRTPESPKTAEVTFPVQLQCLLAFGGAYDLGGISAAGDASAVLPPPLARQTKPLDRVRNLHSAMR